jgi:hypothetical protein
MTKIRAATPFILLAVSVALSVVAARLPWMTLTGHVEYVYVFSSDFPPQMEPTTVVDAGFNRYSLVDNQSCGLCFDYLSQTNKASHQRLLLTGWLMLLARVATWLALGLVYAKAKGLMTGIRKVGQIILLPVIVLACVISIIVVFVELRGCQYNTVCHVEEFTTRFAGPLTSLTSLLFGAAALAIAVVNTRAVDGPSKV